MDDFHVHFVPGIIRAFPNNRDYHVIPVYRIYAHRAINIADLNFRRAVRVESPRLGGRRGGEDEQQGQDHVRAPREV
ncbi:hypothetical protein [Myxococcus sp. SDU36]|uniref:hypothetical protein n=1 Tax=Myxococcus sp. SDU36 TaxID=2831967 RepID=UPI00254329AC|nr:hypothetical protein [Myxococcus sp. SDU36]WIG96657.1 hypothetical protein KGD87_04250 [Myxococcus sp. SDU36]